MKRKKWYGTPIGTYLECAKDWISQYEMGKKLGLPAHDVGVFVRHHKDIFKTKRKVENNICKIMVKSKFVKRRVLW